MKEYYPSAFDGEIWNALYALLWTKDVSGLEKGAAIDGITPERIETNKEGIEID